MQGCLCWLMGIVRTKSKLGRNVKAYECLGTMMLEGMFAFLSYLWKQRSTEAKNYQLRYQQTLIINILSGTAVLLDCGTGPYYFAVF